MSTEVEVIAEDRADWLLDAIACATQNRSFLRGDSEYDEVTGGAILMNGEKAIRVAIDRATTPKDEAIDELVGALRWAVGHIDFAIENHGICLNEAGIGKLVTTRDLIAKHARKP